MHRARLHDVALAIGFFVAYVALDWVSYLQPLDSAGITPWNPPPGLSLALLVARGPAFAGIVLLSALASDWWIRGETTTGAHAIASSLWLAGGYALLAESLRRRFARAPDFRRVSEISWFAGVVAVGVLVVAVGYVASLSLLGPAEPLPFSNQVLQFWVGDVIGILVFTPALLVHGPTRFGHLRDWPRWEALAQAVTTLAATWVLWGIDADLAPRLFYLLFVPLVWMSVRHGVEGATIALVALQFGLIAGLQLTERGEMALELQLLMLALAGTGLLLGASVSERALVERALRERQAELDRSLRLAAASETASALAHELNQPLAALTNYVGACRAMLGDLDRHRGKLEETLSAAAREARHAGDVTRRMREFFQSGATRLERTDVAQLVRSATESMRDAMERSRVSLRLACEPAVGAAMLDRIQIESVVHQLLQNAIDALVAEGSEKRNIVVSVGRKDDRVSVAVADSGPGIAPELQGTVVSPFVTTKPHGMGMGLSVCRTIVENHGGEFRVESSPAGATVSFHIPSRVGPEAA